MSHTREVAVLDDEDLVLDYIDRARRQGESTKWWIKHSPTSEFVQKNARWAARNARKAMMHNALLDKPIKLY